MKLLDKAANVAIILGVTVFVAVIVHDEFLKPKAPDNSPRALVGTSVTLPDLQLNPSHNSLLLAISTTCHFCKDSLPFYKELAAKTQGKVDMVAVLPQPVDEAQTFLQNAGVPAAKIISAKLSAIGVRGTPTLLLVDSKGKVQEEWQGFLDEKKKQQLYARVLQ
jgi:thioredoxin-related protein